jgi:hypothetical protein
VLEVREASGPILRTAAVEDETGTAAVTSR